MYVLGNSYCPLCIYTTKHANVNMKNKNYFSCFFWTFFCVLPVCHTTCHHIVWHYFCINICRVTQ